jgi:hypothetical protein
MIEVYMNKNSQKNTVVFVYRTIAQEKMAMFVGMV